MSGSKGRTSVVLVHGAWADGSSWNDIIMPLLSKGLNVLAAPIPLTSLSDDVAALDRALERTDGPAVLVAHAYAGAVIAATTNERVQSLVFIAALAPDESVTDRSHRCPPPPPQGSRVGIGLLDEGVETGLLLEAVRAGRRVASFLRVRCIRLWRPFYCGCPGLTRSIAYTVEIVTPVRALR